jgi:hypothetical protein
MDSHETYYKLVQGFTTFMLVFMTLFHYNFQYYGTIILPRSNARNYFNFFGILIYSVFFNSINMKHTLVPLILLMYFLNIHINVIIPFFFVVYWVDVSKKISLLNFNVHSYYIQIVFHYLCKQWHLSSTDLKNFKYQLQYPSKVTRLFYKNRCNSRSCMKVKDLYTVECTAV